MNSLLQFLAEHGVMLACGTTVLLVIGGSLLLFQRAPINRQRAGEMTIVAVLAWIGLACIPLPRWSLGEIWPPSRTPAGANIGEPISQQMAMESHDNIPADSAVEAARIRETTEILHKLAELDAEISGIDSLAVNSPMIDWEPYLIDVPVGGEVQDAASLAPLAILQNDSLPTTPPASTSTTGETSRSQRLAIIFLVGSLGCLLWLILGRILLWRVTHSAQTAPQWLTQLYASLSQEKSPRLLVTARCRRAFSCGWWRPTIVLPADCCRKDRREQLRQILLHELAHLRQGDQRGRVLFNAALPLLYAHPLYWWIRSRTYLAAELLADDWAAGHSSTAIYAGELIALVKEQGRRGMAHVGTVGIFSSPTQFYRRMEMLVRRQTPLMTRCTRRWRLLTSVSAIVSVLLLSGLLGVGLVQADSDGEANTNVTEPESSDTKSVEAPAVGASEASKEKASVETVQFGEETPTEQPETKHAYGSVKDSRNSNQNTNTPALRGSFGGVRAPGSFGGVSNQRGGVGRRNRDDDTEFPASRGSFGGVSGPGSFGGVGGPGVFSRGRGEVDTESPASRGSFGGVSGPGSLRDDDDVERPFSSARGGRAGAIHPRDDDERVDHEQIQDGGSRRGGRMGSGRRGADDDVERPFSSARGGPAGAIHHRDDDEERVEQIQEGGMRRAGRMISGRRGGSDGMQSISQLLAKLKTLHRDVLIMKLQLINRRSTAKEQKIRELLDAAATDRANDEQIIKQLYSDMLQEKPKEAELEIVRQIFKLSGNRLDPIFQLLESKGQVDDATRAAVMARELDPRFSELERKMPVLALRFESPKADDISEQDWLTELNAEYYHINDEKSQLKLSMELLYKLDKKLQTVGNPYNNGYPTNSAPDESSSQSRSTTPGHYYSGDGSPLTPPSPRALPQASPTPRDRVSRPPTQSNQQQIKSYTPEPDLSPESTKSPSGDRGPDYVEPDSKQNSKNPSPANPNADRGPQNPKLKTPPLKTPSMESSKPEPEDSQDRVFRYSPHPKPAVDATANSNTDIVSLAVEYSTTSSKLKQAEMKLSRVENLKKKGVISNEEFENAQNELELQTRLLATLKTVVNVLQQTMKAELEAINIELEQATKEKNQVSLAQLRAKLARIEGNLRILETIK